MYPLKKPAPKYHPNTLHFAALRDVISAPSPTPILPSAPEKRGWEYAVPDSVWAKSMLANDQVGDCAEASFLHIRMANSAANRTPEIFTDKDALDLYTAVTGYNPNALLIDGENPTDQGTALTDLLAYAQAKGLILGWAAVNWRDPEELNAAINAFGSVYTGIQVTASMMEDFDNGKPWNGPFVGGNLGGHAVPFFGFGRLGRTCITWAKRQQVGPAFVECFDEVYALIFPEWIESAKNNTTPSGVNLSVLQSALAAQNAQAKLTAATAAAHTAQEWAARVNELQILPEKLQRDDYVQDRIAMLLDLANGKS
jgi:hypothetical protein